ncbi:hypothetical protein ACIA8O_32000 [Kitasatospora sp. NPDC051853]|uniref:hypothetical protein n=1 Tax=Kitasatospora sp. NPDC051853 TaxID=3364058 RepID=UPI00379F069E
MTIAQDGVLTGPDGVGGHVGWAAVRLAPAPGLADHRGYAALPEDRRWAEAGAAELAWLTALCHTPPAAGHLELRITGGLGGPDGTTGAPLRATLLARAPGPTPEVAAAAVRALLAVRPPAHVATAPVREHAALLAELDPVGEGAAAPVLYEIRKRVEVRPLARPTAQRADAVTAAPFAPAGATRELLWTTLARQPHPTCLAVTLAPARLPAEAGPAMRRFAESYAVLALPGTGSPLWQGARRADPSAEAGRDFFDDALRRYLGPAYRLRILLASAGPVDPGLPESVAAQVGGVVVPLPPEQHARARADFTALGADPLPATHRPPALPDANWSLLEHELVGLADQDEAAAAVRLPYEFTGRTARLFEQLPPVETPLPPPSPVRPAGLPPLI